MPDARMRGIRKLVRSSTGGIRKTHNGKTHDECVEAGPGMQFDRLPDGHGMLVVLAIKGVVHEIRVAQDLGALHVDMGDSTAFDPLSLPRELILRLGLNFA